MKKPFRLALAQVVCGTLPPLLAQSVRKKLYPIQRAEADEYEFVVRAQTGSPFHGNTVDRHSYVFAVHGYFMWRSWAIALAVCQPGDCIIEVGANVGTETVGFSDIVGADGKVYGFEPVPSNLAQTEAALREARYRNVELFPYAVSAESGQIRFVMSKSRHDTGIGHIAGDEDLTKGEVITAECVTLDSLALGRAAVIFIDAEGAEPGILSGADAYIRANQPFIMLEVTDRLLRRAGSSVQALFRLITALDYEAYDIRRFGLRRYQPNSNHAANWLCVPREKLGQVDRINRSIQQCGLMPCVPGLNPLSRRNRAV